MKASAYSVSHTQQAARSRREARVCRRSGRERFALVLFVMLTAAVILVASNQHQAIAEDSTALYKYYTSYEIQAGDTLWSIAEQHRDATAQSVRDYIDEVCAINQIAGDDIRSGSTICIPYYSAEYH